MIEKLTKDEAIELCNLTKGAIESPEAQRIPHLRRVLVNTLRAVAEVLELREKENL